MGMNQISHPPVRLQRFLPFLAWIGELRNGRMLRADLIAGITVALVLVPQSMAYAQLAGLPAYYGLYAAFLPPMVAALFGSSRQLATGPVAVVVNFLSHPVILGFTNAAAIIIATSQLDKIFGVRAEKAAHHYETVWNTVVAATQYIHWPTFFIALGAFAIMIVLRRVNPRVPNVLIAVALTTTLSWFMRFEHIETVALEQ